MNVIGCDGRLISSNDHHSVDITVDKLIQEVVEMVRGVLATVIRDDAQC